MTKQTIGKAILILAILIGGLLAIIKHADTIDTYADRDANSKLDDIKKQEWQQQHTACLKDD